MGGEEGRGGGGGGGAGGRRHTGKLQCDIVIQSLKENSHNPFLPKRISKFI